MVFIYLKKHVDDDNGKTRFQLSHPYIFES